MNVVIYALPAAAACTQRCIGDEFVIVPSPSSSSAKVKLSSWEPRDRDQHTANECLSDCTAVCCT